MRLLVLLILVGWLCPPAAVARTRSGARPALVVVLVVDQMRADYPDRYGHQWDGGFARLLREGAWFTNAAYPYLQTVTCAGHATIGTGTYPLAHGIVLNKWWDRSLRKEVACTDDEDAKAVDVVTGRTMPGSESGRRLLVPTLSDRMRAQLLPVPRVVTVAVKPRSAIMLGGHRPDLAVWFSDNQPETSNAMTTPAVFAANQELLRRFVVDFDRVPAWTRTLPATRYHFADDGAGESPPHGWTRTFPHPINVVSAAGSASGAFARWSASPFSDEQVLSLAAELVASMKLGRADVPEYLAVSLSGLDLAGHAFGPLSHEVQDVLVRLDRALTVFLAALDKHVGAGRYTVALTADHGVTLIPEQVRRLGLDAGTIDLGSMQQRLEKVLHDLLRTPGPHVENVQYTDIYLGPGVYKKIAGDPANLKKVLDAIRAQPGVAAAYAADELQSPKPGDPLLRAAALSFHPERSGDLILVPRRNWITVAKGTTHGTSNPDDQRVPIVLWGNGIRPGKYDREVSPADIAPTMARMLKIEMPEVAGRPLVEALK